MRRQTTYCVGVLVLMLIIGLLFLVYTSYTSNRTQKKEGFQEDKLYFFHAKWCGHCIKFLPEVEKFAKKNTITIDIVEDSDITDELRNEFNVNAYPMLFYKNTSKHISTLYEGERTSKGIEEFVDKMRNQM